MLTHTKLEDFTLNMDFGNFGMTFEWGSEDEPEFTTVPISELIEFDPLIGDYFADPFTYRHELQAFAESYFIENELWKGGEYEL